MTHPLISARQLARTYGTGEAAITAVRDVSLEIAHGESVALLGRSGSGKSSLLNLLALMDRPTSGSLAIDGVETSALRPRTVDRIRNRSFGFVFQQFFLTAEETVLENVMLPLTIAGVPAPERRRRARAALRDLEIDHRADRLAGELSGGQKQRVAIARAIVGEPAVVFADEPTGNLDSTTSAVVEDILFGLNAERGIALVVVTHDETLAQRCSRRLRLHDGALLADEAVAA